jgi:hypothetical protein
MIEDIGFLYENNETDSCMIFVDSSLRDRETYKDPGNYVINFDEPFKLVYGFDVLDAAIPNTMYNVDKYNETLAVGIITAAPNVNIEFQSFMNELQYVPLFQKAMSKIINSDILICSKDEWTNYNIDTHLAIPYSENGCELFNQDYIIAVRESLSNIELINCSKGGYSDNSDYVVYSQDALRVAINVNEYPEIVGYIESGSFVVSRDVYGSLQGYKYDLYAVNDVTAVNKGSQTILSMMDHLGTDHITPKSLYYYYFVIRIVSIEKGNYDINSLLLQMSAVLSTNQIEIGSTTTGSVEKASKYMYHCKGDFFFDIKRSTLGTNLGFDTLSLQDDINGSYRKINFQGNNQLFRSIYNAADGHHRFEMIPPGVINVAGVRYMILRCKEFEDHIQNTAFSTMTPGIGMFKLAGGNDITHLRFDFLNLVRKPFHPIGRLTRLTLRFEMVGGNLYDFKGVNHQIIFVIKYYTAKNRPTFDRSILNPEYTPNYIEYMTKNMERNNIEEEEDSECDSENSEEYA